MITGPPGRAVAGRVVPPDQRGQTGEGVLFASKNNKAVDVVEARVNNLGPRPILLRWVRRMPVKLTDI